jgi:quercetin dioxygenase-like cupin family protein
MKPGPWVLGSLMLLSSFGFGQFGTQMKTFSMAQAKFANMAGAPDCATIAPVNGDPTKDVFFIALKMTSACAIPWHWHSGDENVSMISGKAKMETKDGPAHNVNPGDYAYMPAKQPHQFTCTSTCTLFVASPQAFDLHYVDASGNEIPPEQALKASSHKSSGAKKPASSGAKPPSQ